ncbi:MAG TPA: heavy metal translocating P-type ATPase metal-binding domain-containing protein, partial [Burkholderiales bacterium]
MGKETQIACFHCGGPLPAGEREFCCAGCEAVARAITGAGLESYYRTRTRPAARPQPYPRQEDFPEDGAGEAALVLGQVRCAACLWLIEERLRRLPGVRSASVNYATQRAQVEWDPARLRLAEIVGALRQIGYHAFPYDAARAADAARREQRAALWRL